MALTQLIAREIAAAGGWLPFDRYMHLALYAPGLGYYARGDRQFGLMPSEDGGAGGDFVTAPELSPLFAQTLAVQVAEALHATGSDQIWEFGPGSGVLARDLLAALRALGQSVARYTLVDVSGALRARQQTTLAAQADTVRWVDALPAAMTGVVIGNEVLDAMPVKLLVRRAVDDRADGLWYERGVALAGPGTAASDSPFVWSDRPTELRPPADIASGDYVTEIHPQASAFIATLAERLIAGERATGQGGAAFFIDYGFPEAEYWHPQRAMGTLACHRAHRMDDDPLSAPGEKDITAHVNFTGIALAGQDAGLTVLGYTSQARFLLNLGLAERMAASGLPQRANAMKLIAEHEMGELFKVVGFATPGHAWAAHGFAQGDRSHRL
ncbi:MAG: SAM-dependent methyltransferase [Burkholderiaceae bacterium]|jgi:SAM-dependent MidA family methyltransferase|nr:SAM-dependent methyltransferase [Burkholderiaceae bacterium]